MKKTSISSIKKACILLSYTNSTCAFLKNTPIKSRTARYSSFSANTTDFLEVSIDDAWESSLALTKRPYISTLLKDLNGLDLKEFRDAVAWNDEYCYSEDGSFDEELCLAHLSAIKRDVDPLWEQVKIEAKASLVEVEAGPQLYQNILSQKNLLDAIIHVVSNEMETEFMLATLVQNLFHEMLTFEDERNIHLDIMAAAMRSPSVGDALTAILFNRGLHALVCYRVAHRLWEVDRTGLAKYIQSTVSRIYQADIHPACKIGGGIWMKCGAGIVIGETAVVGDDVSIMQGVTLGGTGKEAGDRHPKVGNGVILNDSAAVLGNIKVGDGAVVLPKSIVTKEVPPLARVSGIPAKIHSYRDEIIRKDAVYGFGDEESTDEGALLEQHLKYQYLAQWEVGTSWMKEDDDGLNNTV